MTIRIRGNSVAQGGFNFIESKSPPPLSNGWFLILSAAGSADYFARGLSKSYEEDRIRFNILGFNETSQKTHIIRLSSNGGIIGETHFDLVGASAGRRLLVVKTIEGGGNKLYWSGGWGDPLSASNSRVAWGSVNTDGSDFTMYELTSSIRYITYDGFNLNNITQIRGEYPDRVYCGGLIRSSAGGNFSGALVSFSSSRVNWNKYITVSAPANRYTSVIQIRGGYNSGYILYDTTQQPTIGTAGNSVGLIKFNLAGGIIWQRAWIDNNTNHYSEEMILDSDENIYTFSHSNFSSSYTTYLSKFAPNGNLLWRRGYTALLSALTPTGRGFVVRGAALDADQNLYLTGYQPTTGSTIGSVDGLYCKINRDDGSVLWSGRWGRSERIHNSYQHISLEAERWVIAFNTILSARPGQPSPTYSVGVIGGTIYNPVSGVYNGYTFVSGSIIMTSAALLTNVSSTNRIMVLRSEAMEFSAASYRLYATTSSALDTFTSTTFTSFS